MGFGISNRAFRFTLGSQQYAVDIFNDGIILDDGPAVHLLYRVPDGWNREGEAMKPAMYIHQETIDAAGGIEPLCRIILEKLNKALRIITNNTEQDEDGDVDVPPSALPHEQVMDYLRMHLELKYINGVPTLVLNP